MTPHFTNPVALAQAISGAETQSVVVSEEELVFSAWAVIIEPQSAVAASAWLPATFGIASAGPLITKSSDSNTEMIWRFFEDILNFSTKL